MRTVSRCWSTLWLLLLGLSALFAIDLLLGFVYRTAMTSRITSMFPRSDAARCAIVVFRGYVMPGGLLRRAFSAYLDNDALVVVNPSERGVKVQQIYEMIAAALEAPRPATRSWISGQPRPFHKVISVVVYGRVGSLEVGFSVYALHSAHNELQDAVPAISRHTLLMMAGAAYAFLFALVPRSWKRGFLILGKGGILAEEAEARARS